MTCTTADCNNPTDVYLCAQCVRDLQAWLDRVPETMEMLFDTMAKLDRVAPKRSEGGNGMVTTATIPLRDRAMDKRHALRIWEGQDAHKLAHDQYAAGFQPMLERMIKDAERIVDLPNHWIVYGPCQAPTPEGPCQEELKAEPEATTIDCPACGAFHRVSAIIEDRTKRSRGEPMPPKEVRDYLMKTTRTYITKKDIENWVTHGHLPYVLDRVTTTARPPRIYYPGDVLATHHKMKDRRRVAC